MVLIPSMVLIPFLVMARWPVGARALGRQPRLPFGSPPGAELTHLSVVSAVSLLPRIRAPVDPERSTKGRGPP